MVKLLGLDISGILDGIGSQFEKLVGTDNPFGGIGSGGAGNPFGNIGGGIVGNPFGNMGSGPVGNPFGGFTANTENPFGTFETNTQNPFGGFGASAGNPFGSFSGGGGNPFGLFPGKMEDYSTLKGAGADLVSKPGSSGTGGSSGGWLGSGTGSDNATLSGEKINQYISSTRPNSPLAGMGDFILQEANAKGVSVPQLLGIMTLESGLGTEQGTLPGVYNYGGLTGTGWAGQTGNTTGMAREFATFDSKENGIRALIGNLASDQYRGKSIQQQTGLWYLGNENAGLGSTDEAGNATMQQYLDTIGGVFKALGIGYDPAAAPQRGAGSGSYPQGNYQQAGDLIKSAQSLVGTPYQLGGFREHRDNPRAGIDCSEYTSWIYQQNGYPALPENAQQQYNVTNRVAQPDLRAGDLVFFQGTYDVGNGDVVTHVGMYIGDGKMINAQTGGVMEANLNDPYWRDHIYGYGRVPGVGPGGRPA